MWSHFTEGANGEQERERKMVSFQALGHKIITCHVSHQNEKLLSKASACCLRSTELLEFGGLNMDSARLFGPGSSLTGDLKK